jgi:hypothetical protein
LVEVVPDAADGLRDEQAGRGGVEKRRDVGAAAMKNDQPGERAAGDAPPDPEPALPDRERTPPVGRDLVPARGDVVQAAADQPGGKAPEGDLLDELARSAASFPPSCRKPDRGDDGDDVRQPVGVNEERPDVEAIRGRTRNAGKRGAQNPTDDRQRRSRRSIKLD